MSDTTTTTAATAAPQVALVTGASRGIGRAIAQALAGAGFRVVGTATTEAGAAAIGAALAPMGGQGIVLNVTDGAALDAAIDGIVKAHDLRRVLGLSLVTTLNAPIEDTRAGVFRM
jgi:3-oxoacyl-[acyl-carrier protein] reductase